VSLWFSLLRKFPPPDDVVGVRFFFFFAGRLEFAFFVRRVASCVELRVAAWSCDHNEGRPSNHPSSRRGVGRVWDDSARRIGLGQRLLPLPNQRRRSPTMQTRPRCGGASAATFVALPSRSSLVVTDLKAACWRLHSDMPSLYGLHIDSAARPERPLRQSRSGDSTIENSRRVPSVTPLLRSRMAREAMGRPLCLPGTRHHVRQAPTRTSHPVEMVAHPSLPGLCVRVRLVCSNSGKLAIFPSAQVAHFGWLAVRPCLHLVDGRYTLRMDSCAR
jgi:hypothetical protein